MKLILSVLVSAALVHAAADPTPSELVDMINELRDELIQDEAIIAAQQAELQRVEMDASGELNTIMVMTDEDTPLTVTQATLLKLEMNGGNTMSAANMVAGGAPVTVSSSGDDFIVTPDADWNGVTSVSFDVLDSNGALMHTRSLTIAVSPTPDEPVAPVPLPTFTTNEDTIFTLTSAQVVAGWTDVDADDITCTSVSATGANAAHLHIMSLGPDSWQITPQPDWSGTVELEGTITDGVHTLDVSLGFVEVLAVNDAPVVNDVVLAQTHEDTHNSGNAITLTQAMLLEHATDVDNQLTAENLQCTANPNTAITITAMLDSSFEVSMPTHWNGNLDCTFDVTDGTHIISADAHVTVIPVNDAPDSLLADTFTMAEDSSMSLTETTILSYATDVDHLNNDLSVVGFGTMQGHEDAIFTQNGASYDFHFAQDWNGQSTVYFTVEDAGGLTGTLTFDIVVTPVNDAPTVTSPPLTITMNEDEVKSVPFTWLASHFSDVESDPSTFVFVSLDAYAVSGTDFTVTMPANFNGQTSATLTLTDDSDTFTYPVTIDVLPVNDAPHILSPTSAYTSDEDVPLMLSESTLLTFMGDVDADPLTITGITMTNSSPTCSSLSTSHVGDDISIICADADYNGDIDFELAVSDGTATTNLPATVTFDPVDDAPTCIDIASTGVEDTQFVIDTASLIAALNDIDSDVNTASFSISEKAGWQHSVTVKSGNNEFLIDFPAHFHGDALLTFEATLDSHSVMCDLTIDVSSVNDVPTVHSTVQVTADEDSTFTLTQSALLAIAADDDHQVSELTALDLTGPVGMTITQVGDDFECTLPHNHVTAITLTYTIQDPELATVSASVNVQITPVNDIPVFNGAIQIGATEDMTADIPFSTIEGRFSDVDIGDVLTAVSLVPQDMSANAIVTQVTQSGSTFTLHFRADAHGVASLTATVQDIAGATASGTITVNVVPVNDAPVEATPLVLNAVEDTPRTVLSSDILIAVSDVDGDTLSVTSLVSMSPDVTVSSVSATEWSLTATANFNGDVTLQYTINDGTTDVTFQATLTIAPVNDAPTISALTHTATEDVMVVLGPTELLDGVADIDSNINLLLVHTMAVDTGVNADPGVTITADAMLANTFNIVFPQDWFGDLVFSYVVDDGAAAGTTINQITVTVQAVNDAPVAPNALVLQMQEDGTLDLPESLLLSVVSDVDNTVAELSVVVGTLAMTGSETAPGGETAVTVSYQAASGNDEAVWTLSLGPHYFGMLMLSFDVTDGIETVTVQLDLTVLGVNDAPIVLGELVVMMDEDQTATLEASSIITMINEVDNDVLTVPMVIPMNGDVSVTQVDADTWTLTPAPDAFGSATLLATITDGTYSTSVFVAVTIMEVNDGPTETHALTMWKTFEGQSVVLTLEDMLDGMVDVDSVMGVTAVTSSDPLFHSVTMQVSGDVIVTFTQADPVATIALEITVSDGEIDYVRQALLYLNMPNTAPTLTHSNIVVTMDEDTPVTRSVAELLTATGAQDADGDQLTVVNMQMIDPASPVAVAWDDTNSVFVFTPEPDFFTTGVQGEEIYASFEVSDGKAAVGQMVVVECMVAPINDAPEIELQVISGMAVGGSMLLTSDMLITGDTSDPMNPVYDKDTPKEQLFVSNVAIALDTGHTVTQVGNDWLIGGMLDENTMSAAVSYQVSDGISVSESSMAILFAEEQPNN